MKQTVLIKTFKSITACIFAAVLLLSVLPAFGWDIPSYDTRMEIQPDSSVNVTETIVADFAEEPHHGIYQDIILAAKDRMGNSYRLRIDNVRVTDEAGNVQQITLMNRPGGEVRIRIGDPNNMITGTHTYVIHYRLLRAIRFFEEHDELYFNVVGFKWEVPIKSATCEVVLPKAVEPGKLQTACYTGPYGSTSTDAQYSIDNNRSVRFAATRPLNFGEGMSVVVGWPKGIITPPTFNQQLKWFLADNSCYMVPVVFLFGMVVLWFKAGKDPDTGKSEVVAYDPPDDLRPAELGTLIDESVDMRDISATIIDLAVRGFLTIRPVSQKGIIFSSTDYTLQLVKHYPATINNPELKDFERELIKGLFDDMNFCLVSDLKNKFYTHIPKIQNHLYDSMIMRKYFAARPDSTRKLYQTLGIVALAAGVISSIILSSDGAPVAIPVGWGISMAICGVILLLASKAMPKKTAKGKDTLLAIRGFEEYLSRAERREIEYQERQGYFEKFLPYAMAFGIADRWAKAFNGIQTTPPSWYIGGDNYVFSPIHFTHDLNSACSGWSNTMASTPRSNSGSSGFGGGGGFSGGGSGGGGGGGW